MSGGAPSSPPRQGGGYTRSEVAWLLGLDREGAIDFDAVPRDSLHQSEESLSANAEESLFAIARWHDVHAARRSITRDNVIAEVMKLRANHFTEHEIAVMVGLNRSTVRRRYVATLDQLLERLGEVVDPPRTSTVPSCISCGKAIRVRLAAIVMERWTCMGRRVRPDDGQMAQAWWTPGGKVRLCRPPLAWSAAIGGAADVLVTQGTVLSHELRRDEDLSEDDGRVKAWKNDTQASIEGRPTTWNEDLYPRVPAGRREVEPEKQAGCCARCLMPELRVRVLAPWRPRQLTEEQQQARAREREREDREQLGSSGGQ